MMQKFLTSKEAANYLNISEEDLGRLMENNTLSSYKIGGVYTRFKTEDLDSYRRRTKNRSNEEGAGILSDKIKDLIYFNDFYILSGLSIALILYFIFK
ncbi:MAG: helix-turn-helix domain-containing protein [Candidatus Omnitrophota bacterium]